MVHSMKSARKDGIPKVNPREMTARNERRLQKKGPSHVSSARIDNYAKKSKRK